VVFNIYDTLVIHGNLTVGNNGFFNVNENAVVIVYGDVLVNNNLDVGLNSYFVVFNDFTQENNSDINAPDDEIYLYVTGTSDCGNQAECLPADSVGNEEDIYQNPDISDVVADNLDMILPTNPVFCPGSFVELSIR